MGKFDIILWDVDQTLLDFKKSESYAIRFCFRKFGKEASDETARKLKIMENEKHPHDDLKNVEITKNMKNEKCTLKDMEYGEKTENHG